MSAAYGTILLDLDHTIFDFDASELSAFASAMTLLGFDDAAPHLPAYQSLNNAMWAAAERGEMRSSDIRNLRFHRLAEQLGVGIDETEVVAVADHFVHGLGLHGELYPDALDVLHTLAGCVQLGLISNGLGEVVHARLDRLRIGHLFAAVVVSSEVGVSKPDPRIFDHALDQLGKPARSSVLMVGDSLTSDIAGGQAAGIDTCWFNPHGRQAPTNPPTYEIATLADVVHIAGCR